MNTARRGQARANPSVEHRDPPHRQAHRHRRAQQDVGRNFQRLEFNVRLIETIEQHQPIGAVRGRPRARSAQSS